MLSKSLIAQRGFSSKVCILAHSRQSDLVGAKIMKSLKAAEPNEQIEFIGYGG